MKVFDMCKKISVLGSTGSIGTQSLDVASKGGFEVVSLAVNSNIKMLEQQARQFLPRLVCVFDEKKYKELKQNLSDTDIEVCAGMEGLCRAASLPEANVVINSVVGMIGLVPTLAAIDSGHDVALANKETLVTGGEIVMKRAKEKGVKILPVDSEHSAIFQCIGAGRKQDVKKIILTASGGPFFGKTAAELESVGVKQALNHPNWNMGAKITIDSATLMNKGLEFIEAVRLFDVAPGQIEVVVHRESIIHSAVEFNDNSVIAQMGVPDMRIPIQYALTYPKRVKSPVKPLSLIECAKLTFFPPDEETFVCLKAARSAIEKGGVYPTYINGANEQAVALFLQGKIGFTKIGELVLGALGLDRIDGELTVDKILRADKSAREYIMNNS